MKLGLPQELIQIAERHCGPALEEIQGMMRSAEECATPISLNAQKATRLSFTQLLARRMIDERWTFSKQHVEFDAGGRGFLIYQIDFGRYQSTYLVQSFLAAPTPSENLGLRAGAKRDLWGTLFLGCASAERIDGELRIIASRDIATMRARSDVPPSARSAKISMEIQRLG